MDIASGYTGRIQTKLNDIESYFSLRKENELLRQRLTTMLNEQKENFQTADTGTVLRTERLLTDTVWTERKYVYRDAEVVNNSIAQPNNFITLHRGSKQGIQPGMVVVGPLGAVGVVLDVNDNFAFAMSMLHKQSRISARLKKTGEAGRIEWDGADPRIVQMKDITKSAKPQKGDTIITSQYSDFPPGIPVGVIEKATPDKSSNFFQIQVRPFTDFSRLHHVFVVENLQRQEQLELERRSKPKQ